MKDTSRLALMVIGLAVAVYSVATIKHWVEDNAQQSTLSIGGDQDPSRAVPSRPQVTRQPRILQAKPVVGSRHASPRYQEQMLSSPAAQPNQAADYLSDPPPARPLPRQIEGLDDSPFPQVPNPLADELMESAAFTPSGAASGWPDESHQQSATWTTGENDSLWDISLARYESGAYYHALFEFNRRRIHRPDRLPAGLTLETPAVATLRARFPLLCPPLDEKSDGG